MPKTTPDDKTLERFVQGKLSRRENLKVAWHLYNSAASRKRVEELGGEAILANLFKDMEVADSQEEPTYDRAFSLSRSTLEVQGETRDRDRLRAPKLFAELMRHPVSRQRKLLERTWRFKNYVFGEFLLEQSFENMFDDPARAEDLAELALVVAHQLEGTHYGPALVNDLKAKAWAFLSNAQRAGSDLRSADESMKKAHTHLAEGTDDPLLRARIVVLESQLRSDQRKFKNAFALIDEALAIYREAGEDHWTGRTLLTQANILDTANEQEKAIKVLNSALTLVDTEREPRLSFMIQQNLAAYLAHLGKYGEAAKLLPAIRQSALELGDSLLPLRLRYLEAKIAAGQRKWKEAERAYIEARDTFADSGMGYDAALVSLDLALMYAQRGRTSEVKQLASEMVSIFKSRDVHREAHAALLVFQKAAAAEKANLKMLEGIAGYLKQARNNPELQYKAS